MTDINYMRIIVVLLFSITFTLIGWLAPVIYVSYVSQDSIIEVHEFEAQGTTVNSDVHHICFDRTIHQPSTGEVFTELYIVDDKEGRIQVDDNHMNRYFAHGRREVITELNLEKDLSPGTYRYLLVTKMELADGRVVRSFAFESNPFEITEQSREIGSEKPIC